MAIKSVTTCDVCGTVDDGTKKFRQFVKTKVQDGETVNQPVDICGPDAAAITVADGFHDPPTPPTPPPA